MLQLKLSYAAQIVSANYSLLLSDADSVYLADPLEFVRKRLPKDVDLLIQVNKIKSQFVFAFFIVG